MKARFESRAIAEVAGDAAATDTLWLVIPDPLTPLDRTALARRTRKELAQEVPCEIGGRRIRSVGYDGRCQAYWRWRATYPFFSIRHCKAGRAHRDWHREENGG